MMARMEIFMQRIVLGHNKFAVVDDADYDELMKYTWGLGTKKCGTQYAIRKIWRNNKRTTISMQQTILGTKDGFVSDHINGDGLDNRRENLRLCTARHNCMNRKPQSGTSKYKGVSQHGKKWSARIKTQGKIYNLGHYNTQEVAACVYNIAAKIMFGDFARLNEVV